MDMSSSSNSTYSQSMTWNWNTVGTCFLAESWQVESEGAFAASCIGVFFLVIYLELVRRLGKEYDTFILRQFRQHATAQFRASKEDSSCCSDAPAPGPQVVTFRATPLQQLIRSVVHAASFGVAYILMLIAMSFNGYIIISIIIGAGFGKFLCDWMIAKVVVGGENEAQPDKGAEGLEEASVCCG
ncbi:copper transport protein ctr4 [Annulohypoxylon maeteangense]|uniref:copper transport protein ctr4 n=1 Tax=Annulohypoxylon maeteangense TaxID=1927788 RepID=UPI0020079452|nr:copper transport protein ctr4 [Annulohypoxylon maeteangense]KAI0884130.1 copper transport protein ctr4 [Annulohypoxylon maeteangense]